MVQPQAQGASTNDVGSKSVPEVLGELKQLTIDYAKQETIDPLKGLGRFVAFGVGGSFLLAIGVILLSLAGLRALQTETGTTFTGNWSWAPYVFAFLLLVLLAGLAVYAIGRETRKRRKELEA